MILPETTTVAADEWVSQHRYLRDSGLRFFDLLVAVDLGDQVTEVVTHVMSADATRRAMSRIEVRREERIPSLVEVFRRLPGMSVRRTTRTVSNSLGMAIFGC